MNHSSGSRIPVYRRLAESKKQHRATISWQTNKNKMENEIYGTTVNFLRQSDKQAKAEKSRSLVVDADMYEPVSKVILEREQIVAEIERLETEQRNLIKETNLLKHVSVEREQLINEISALLNERDKLKRKEEKIITAKRKVAKQKDAIGRLMHSTNVTEESVEKTLERMTDSFMEITESEAIPKMISDEKFTFPDPVETITPSRPRPYTIAIVPKRQITPEPSQFPEIQISGNMYKQGRNKRWQFRLFAFYSDNTLICYFPRKISLGTTVDPKSRQVQDLSHPAIRKQLIRYKIPMNEWPYILVTSSYILRPKWIIPLSTVINIYTLQSMNSERSWISLLRFMESTAIDENAVRQFVKHVSDRCFYIATNERAYVMKTNSLEDLYCWMMVLVNLWKVKWEDYPDWRESIIEASSREE